MKKIILFMLFLSGVANAQIINFPDPNFKQALLNSNYVQDINDNFLPFIDTNLNGEIEFSEAAVIGAFSVDNGNISDLNGIQAFINLKSFSCYNNNLTTLDLQGMNSLIIVACGNNQLTSINTSGLTLLDTVDFSGNPNLSTIDFSGCIAMTSFNTTTLNTLAFLNLNNCSGLTSVNVNSTALSYLNVDGCSGLHNISVQNSQLVMLMLTDKPNLTWANISNNPSLSNLVMFNCPAISDLNCGYNALTSLDVNAFTTLTSLACNNNNLTSLFIPGLVNLNFLGCQFNQLNTLYVAPLVNLINIYCNNNQLTTIDASALTHLQYLGAENNLLQSMYAKNGANEILSFTNNPNLAFICADDVQITTVQGQLNTAGMTTTVVNSYCSFVPGGTYNTITGTIRLDSNNNGCDASDAAKQNIRVNINDGTNQGATFTNGSGVYTFYTQAGNFTIAPVVENPTFFSFSPTSAAIPFANTNYNNTTQNFCITANGTHQDLEVVVEPITPARPGFDATYRIVYRNKGNTAVSGSVVFTFNDAKIDYISATTVPNTIATGSLTWNYTNLLPFETRSVKVTLNINSAVETPAVNIGDILTFGATINPTGGDDLPLDNTFAYNQTVVGAFDPNNIACIEGTNLPPSEIGKYLHYAINFENTGNFAAQNVVVKDVIDTTKYDITTLQLQNASHPVYSRITGNVVEFIFQNINLAAVGGNPPVGGHGDILFKIKSKSNLVAGNTVSKSAGIYFDYNAPINTNNAQTTFSSLNNAVHEFDNSVKVYPNPAKGIINISSEYVIGSVSLFDIEGRVLETILENSNEVKIDIASKSNGIYFLKINSEKGSKIEKIVKE